MRAVALALVLLVGCAPAARPGLPTHQARNNVLMSFDSDWECLTASRGACQRAIAEHLRRTFAEYDVAFWLAGDHQRVDGITLFFETGSGEEWGGGPHTVGYSPERCAPEEQGGVISGASVIFHCGDRSDHGPGFCAGAAAHEIGHLLGLEHVVGDDRDLMHHYLREGNVFGHAEVATEGLCRGVQDDSAMIARVLGLAARDNW